MSCGWDSSIFLWKLLHDVNTPENPNDPVWEFRLKNNTGNCVAIYRPDDLESHFQPIVYATSTDKTIRELKTIVQGSGETVQLKVKESQRFEEQTTFNQVLCTFQRKFLICGTSEQDKPSSIQIFKRDFAKICEIQAHSKQLSRLRLSFDNTKLFSVGEDGVLAIYSLIDKEQRKKDAPTLPPVLTSDKILIEKRRRDDLLQENYRLDEDIRSLQE